MLNPLEGIESLAASVIELRDDPAVKLMVDERVAEFLEVREMGSDVWFEELTYCLLTAY